MAVYGHRMPPIGLPIVASIGHAAELFGLDPDRLGRAVEAAQLEPWPGCHADGSRVYPFPALAKVAVGLGARVPATLGHYWARDGAADRGRRNQHRQKAKQ